MERHRRRNRRASAPVLVVAERTPRARRRIRVWGAITLAIALGLGFAAFAYFYLEAEATLDAWLGGRLGQSEPTIFYAAPRRLRVGQRLSREKLLEHLSRAGYTEYSKTEDPRRSRYRLARQSVEIWPGVLAQEHFPRLRILFSRDGHTIQRLVDAKTGRELESALLEPEPIGSLARAVGAPTDSGRGLRLEVEYRQLPRHLVHAIIAVEDKRFFEHTGVDYMGILRALWHDLRAGEAVQGGSTITQQLVKNILVGPERTLRRKLREAFLAVALERRLSKEEIFTRYVNVIYLGRRGGLSVYGVGAAAREYFDKDVSQLTLPESAFLAGIIHRPGFYITAAPRPEVVERGLRRRNRVLDLMAEQGFITPAEAEAAKQAPLGLRFRAGRPGTEVSAPYFLDYVQEQLAESFPTSDLGRLGYRVYTTIDMDLQRAATAVLTEGLERLDRDLARRRERIPPGTVQGALVALHAHTGEILAMMGGRNYVESQFNRVTDAQRQPGSAIKPFVYAAALESGEHEGRPITLADLYMDEPRTFEGGYAPKNFGDTYLLRPVSVREALARSLNVVTVQIAQETGYGTVARMIERCGLPRPPAHAATALGASEVTPLELAAAYTVFPNGGERVAPFAITRIVTAEGQVLEEATPRRTPALSAAVAYLVTSALQSVITESYGTGHAAAGLGLPAVAGKTGTSQRSDAWFVGFTPHVVVAVWVGFDDNRPLPLAASRAALPIWIAFMRQVALLRPDLTGGSFAPPEGIVERVVDPQTGLRATDHCPEKRTELFLQDREITELCTLHPGHPVEELPPPEVPPETPPLLVPHEEPPPPAESPSAPRARPLRTRPLF
jgi:penicillin-binding protein 1B